MPIPGTTFAEWLRSDALYRWVLDLGVQSAWGDDSPQSERITALTNNADALNEAVRERTFMGAPMAREVHKIRGRLIPYIGKVITITHPRLGYATGLQVLVLGAQDDHATGLSTVTVLRRLT